MARPRKMTTEQMISVVDSYYLVHANGNEKRMKCSLIAAYAVELGYQAQGYDFARNPEVREHIERIKCVAEIDADVGIHTHVSYKSLDVAEFIRCNKNKIDLVKALSELDSYWKKIYEHSSVLRAKNKKLTQINAELEISVQKLKTDIEKLNYEKTDISKKNSKIIAENRYLRKVLKKYLYPAVANEILLEENAIKDAETHLTENAAMDMIEFDKPQSLDEHMRQDIRIQSEEERLLSKMWGICDE